MSRRKGRYERRKTRREENRLRRAATVGGLHDVFGYDDMYKAGKKCCNGVRWKNSTQRFEMHLFSGTARRRRLLLERKWIPGAYVHFTISERGKTRPIDAPRIQDRQVHKVYTKKVLLPLYRPEMIYNNGASLEGKGFEFSKRMLKEDLRWHFRRYGRDGNVILIDFKQFFPSVSHEEIFKRHEKLLLNPDIRKNRRRCCQHCFGRSWSTAWCRAKSGRNDCVSVCTGQLYQMPALYQVRRSLHGRLLRHCSA